MIIVMMTLLAAAAPSAEVEPKVRVVSSERSLAERHEDGGLVISVKPARGGLSVMVERERQCWTDTIETENREHVREKPDAVPTGLALAGAGAVGLVGSGVAALLAPQQPLIDDEFSRGELSREGTYAIAAAAGIVGVIGLGGGVTFAILGGEEVVNRDTRKHVVSSTRDDDCDAPPSPDADVTIKIWNAGTPLTGSTTNGVAVVDVDAVHFSPPPAGTAWATIEARVDDERAVTVWDPTVATFAKLLPHTITDLERFKNRFGSRPEWESLRPRYEQLVAARDAEVAARERAAEEERRKRSDALIADVLIALRTGDVLTARAKLAEATTLGADVSSIQAEVDAAASKAGRAHLVRAMAFAKAGKPSDAEQEVAEAARLGTSTTPQLDGEIARAREAAGRRHHVRAMALVKASRLEEAFDEALQAQKYGVELSEAYKSAFAAAQRKRQEAGDVEQLTKAIGDELYLFLGNSWVLVDRIKGGRVDPSCAQLRILILREGVQACQTIDRAKWLGASSRRALIKGVERQVTRETDRVIGAAVAGILASSLDGNVQVAHCDGWALSAAFMGDMREVKEWWPRCSGSR